MAQLPNFTTYTGPTSGLKKSPWLGVEDINFGRDVVVEIEGVMIADQVTWNGGRKERDVAFITFVGKDKMLKCSPTIRKALNALLGPVVGTDWVGQRIALYVDPDVTMAGKKVGGVRVRNKRLEAKKARAEEAIRERPAEDEPPAPAPAAAPEATEPFDAPFDD